MKIKKRNSKARAPAVPPSEASAERPTRGPQPAFSREQIAAAAVSVADAEGIEAVSMRRIAAELGSGAASLYRYVAKKHELLDLMVEVVLAEDISLKLSGNWRRDLEKIADRGRTMILRHPWMIDISTFRSALGPNTLRWLEMTLHVIDGFGLDIDEMLAVSNTLLAFARGYAAGEIAEQQTARRSGFTREEWMRSRTHLTRALLATGKYPMFARVVIEAKAPHDPHAAERGFSRGLEHILNGVEAQMVEVQISARNPRRAKRAAAKTSKRPSRSPCLLSSGD